MLFFCVVAFALYGQKAKMSKTTVLPRLCLENFYTVKFTMTNRSTIKPRIFQSRSLSEIALMVFMLLCLGCQRALDGDGQTELHWAIEVNQDIEVIKTLISEGADVNAKDKFGLTPLHVAADNGNIEITKFLVSSGAKVDAKDNDGETPLNMAVERIGSIAVVEFLVSKGANVNRKFDDGTTPLINAVLSKRTEIVEFLVYKGADVNTKTKHGRTPLHYASLTPLIWLKRGDANFEIAKFLVSSGAKVDAKDNDGATPLHIAADTGDENLEVIKFLISQGANVKEKNKAGNTPLDLAMSANHTAIIEYLSGITVQE